MKLFPTVTSALAVVCIITSSALAVSEGTDVSSVVNQELKLTPTVQRYLQTSNDSTSDTPAETSTPPATSTPPTTSTPPDTPTPPDSPTPAPPTRTPVDPPTTPTPTPPTSTPPVSPPTSTPPTPASPPTPSSPPSPPSTPPTDAPTPTTDTPSAPTTPDTPGGTTPTPDTTTKTPEATPSTPKVTPSTPTTPSTPDTPTSPTDTTPSQANTPLLSTPTAPGAAPGAAPGTTSGNAASSGSGSSSSAETISDTSSATMSTGAVIGIVVGIIAVVAIISAIIMYLIRRRRDSEDDPLSPFELSMDKGFNPTPGGFNAQNSSNTRAMCVPAGNGMTSNTRTPPANAVAAGVAYSNFYDNAPTSPDSMNRNKRNADPVQADFGNNAATNGTNLWLSAMEPKDNESYLSAQESPRSSHNSSRNSYDLSSARNIDMDQSSIISGHSNKESEDFPDHNDDNDSARGSYEL